MFVIVEVQILIYSPSHVPSRQVLLSSYNTVNKNTGLHKPLYTCRRSLKRSWRRGGMRQAVALAASEAQLALETNRIVPVAADVAVEMDLEC